MPSTKRGKAPANPRILKRLEIGICQRRDCTKPIDVSRNSIFCTQHLEDQNMVRRQKYRESRDQGNPRKVVRFIHVSDPAHLSGSTSSMDAAQQPGSSSMQRNSHNDGAQVFQGTIQSTTASQIPPAENHMQLDQSWQGVDASQLGYGNAADSEPSNYNYYNFSATQSNIIPWSEFGSPPHAPQPGDNSGTGSQLSSHNYHNSTTSSNSIPWSEVASPLDALQLGGGNEPDADPSSYPYYGDYNAGSSYYQS
ncbi:hypothetical protein F4677DRAFT_447196 [Hypoxylon crocopeplum]|nr:hypothetical protein F4677DRAFT_447196 [Hypoxylon crocopeplum]